jgi:hypothetical protein
MLGRRTFRGFQACCRGRSPRVGRGLITTTFHRCPGRTARFRARDRGPGGWLGQGERFAEIENLVSRRWCLALTLSCSRGPGYWVRVASY